MQLSVGFILSSSFVDKISEHADDVSKHIGWNWVTLLATLWKSLCRFMLRKVQYLRNCSSFFRITWRSVILLMCCALRIAVGNSKGKIWKSIWRMTVQIGPSLAPSALKRFCGTRRRFVLRTYCPLSWKGLQLTLLWLTCSSYFHYTWFDEEYGHVKLRYWNSSGNQSVHK